MNLPNKITMLRVFLIPIFIMALLVPFPGHKWLGLIVFIVASVTDFVDGHIARSRSLITDFGKFMDPLADKLLTSAAFICLVELHYISSWVVIAILSREFAITGLRTLAASDNIVIAASQWGKAKTVSQMITIISLLLVNAYPIDFLLLFGKVMTYVALALTVYSGYDYFKLNKNVIKSY